MKRTEIAILTLIMMLFISESVLAATTWIGPYSVGSVNSLSTTGEVVIYGPSDNLYYDNPASCGMSHVIFEPNETPYMKETLAVAMLAQTTNKQVYIGVSDNTCGYNDVDAQWYILGRGIKITDN